MNDIHSESDDTWVPQPDQVERAQVTAFGRQLGMPDYDALHAFSLRQPAEYWEGALQFLGIRWRRFPEGYVDTGAGEQFPRWFPGGELNWVETVLARGEDSATRDARALVAEQEDGTRIVLSWSSLATRVRSFAAGLQGRGLRRGDRVGLLCENGMEATVSVLALSYLGCIVVPLFSGFGADAIVSRLEPSGARALIATTGFYRRDRPVDMKHAVREAVQRLPEIELVIWKTSRPDALPPGAVTWAEIAAVQADPGPAEQMTSDSPFMIIYTSGTTGKPKGIVHTHAGFPLKVAHDAAVHWDIGAGDVFFWAVDMGWIAGPIALCAALMRGATLVCYDGAPDFPDWSRMSRIIEEQRVTHFGAAPTLIRGFAANEADALRGDKSSVRLLITAGEGIDPSHFTWFRRHFGGPGSPLMNSTGGTEVSGLLLGSVVVRPIKPAAFNTSSPGVDVAVVNGAGQDVIDEVGELAIRAPFVGMTQSFWGDDKRYLEAYWQTIPGLWVHGDLAIQTAHDGFFMLGRSDDTLKIAGKRMGPAEVEQILLGSDAVLEAAAVGVSDATKGERLVVFVVTRPEFAGNRSDLERTLADAVAEQLGKPFRPSAVHVVAQLPKTRTSKIMRRLIKQVCSNQLLGDISSLDNPAALDEIRAAIRI